MAFEDLYNETEVIPAGGDYWIKIKTSLTHAEKERADRFLHKVQGTVDEKGNMRPVVAPDMDSHRRVMVERSIVEWNLDEADGTVWALSPDSARQRNIDRLPAVVFDRIWERVSELNDRDPRQERAFRHSTAGRDQDGSGRTSDASEVPDGTEVVGTIGNTGAPTG